MNSSSFVVALCFILLAIPCHAQSIDFNFRHLHPLKVKSITVSSGYYRDTVFTDFGIQSKFIYDDSCRLIEERYDYREVHRSYRNYIPNYTSKLYTYDENGRLVNIQIVNPQMDFSDGKVSKQYDCEYYNERGDLIRTEYHYEAGLLGSIEVYEGWGESIYEYKAFSYILEGLERTTYLPIRIKSSFKGKPSSITTYEYEF
ncbi:MAG: hypothetical protein QNK23_11280 [Crocinitomicaceae bacterium]|nr:hypothetical protein [Crocinitomicaceae bacterium]